MRNARYDKCTSKKEEINSLLTAEDAKRRCLSIGGVCLVKDKFKINRINISTLFVQQSMLIIFLKFSLRP